MFNKINRGCWIDNLPDHADLTLIDDLLEDMPGTALGNLAFLSEPLQLSGTNPTRKPDLESVILDPSLQIHVVDTKLRHLLVLADSLPRGCVIDLAWPRTKKEYEMATLAQSFRHKFMPNQHFERAIVSRGVLADIHEATEGLMVIWKRSDTKRLIKIVQLPFEKVLDLQTDVSIYTFMWFCNPFDSVPDVPDVPMPPVPELQVPPEPPNPPTMDIPPVGPNTAVNIQPAPPPQDLPWVPDNQHQLNRPPSPRSPSRPRPSNPPDSPRPSKRHSPTRINSGSAPAPKNASRCIREPKEPNLPPFPIPVPQTPVPSEVPVPQTPIPSQPSSQHTVPHYHLDTDDENDDPSQSSAESMSASQQLAFQLKSQLSSPDLYCPDTPAPVEQDPYYDKAFLVLKHTSSFCVPVLNKDVELDLDNLPLDTCWTMEVADEYSPDVPSRFQNQCFHNIVQDLSYTSRNSCASTTKLAKKRKEVSAKEVKENAKVFLQAKLLEITDWKDKQVYELVDLRKLPVKQRRNYVAGRWVLTWKKDKDGNVIKAKARWVLRGFQDQQKDFVVVDSPTATRPGLRLALQWAANRNFDFHTFDLKTAFLQGDGYSEEEGRFVLAQLPPEMNLPWYMAAKMVKSAYGLNDAPRKWWDRLDRSLRAKGLTPTRADRCTYVLLGKYLPHATYDKDIKYDDLRSEKLTQLLSDPVSSSASLGRQVHGVLVLHVDDGLWTGDAVFKKSVIDPLFKEYQVGATATNDLAFLSQHIVKHRDHISIDQNTAIGEMEEVKIPRGTPDDLKLDPYMHTEYRSKLGQVNYFQNKTQLHATFRFSRLASAAHSPTVKDLKELNKLIREIKFNPVQLNLYKLTGPLRLIVIPDASYQNNSDGSSQRGLVICLAEQRKPNQTGTRGSVIEYESHKINRTTLNVTVAELYSLMKGYGTGQWIRGLWTDLSGEQVELHLRTDALNLVTTARTTHPPEQRETIHMINMMRHEAQQGSWDDFGHVPAVHCLADCLTKMAADNAHLLAAIKTGWLKSMDLYPLFRTTVRTAFSVQDAELHEL